MQSEFLPELITPASIIFGVVFGAGRVKAAIDELRRAVDRLEAAVQLIETRTHEVEQSVARVEGHAACRCWSLVASPRKEVGCLSLLPKR